MSKVAVLFQFRRAFPQERVGSDCAFPNRQFQKTAFSVFQFPPSIAGDFCCQQKMAFQFQFPAGSFQKRPFQFQFPAGSFKKRLFQFQFPAGSFKKTAFPVSIPSRQFQKGAMRGQKKRGVCKGAWPFFTKKGLKVAVFVQFRRTFPRKKIVIRQLRFPAKGSDCGIPSRQFQKTVFSVSVPKQLFVVWQQGQ